MTRQHAVIQIDHHQARIHRFDFEHLEARRVKTRTHVTADRGSEVFPLVCDAMADVDELLVVGGRHALADFGRYAREHRPDIAAKILGYDVVNHPTELQLIAFARQFFLRHEHLVDIGAQPPMR